MGNRISEVLKEQGRSKTWLSEKLGVHKSNVYSWASNRIQPKAGRIKQIAGILGVSMESLVE